MVNEWYHQCIPGSQAPSTTTSRSSTTPTPTTTSSRTTTTSQGQITTTTPTTTQPPVVTGSVTATYSGNPFSGVQMWANAYYKSEVSTLALPSLTGAMATAAAKVADVPSYQWLDRNVTIDTIFAQSLREIRAANQAGANPPYAGLWVVYDLPDRDCAAAASNGEFAIADGGVAKYKAYIDAIRQKLIQYSDIRHLIVVEPDSLANMVTNLNVPKCAGAEAAYRECTKYALQQLNLPNVAMYMDAGHAGWLGWPANIQPAATLFAGIYKEAGSPKALRGLATNVANYNAWELSSAPAMTSPNPNFDEKKYIEAFRPLLEAAGFPAQFIVDQGRSGKQPTGQLEWGHWCNAMGTGFGRRPTANTGHSLTDAFVWIKPGGESDGTSDTTAARYDHFCGNADALKPAPEAGQWFQKYFEQLLTNANPSFL